MTVVGHFDQLLINMSRDKFFDQRMGGIPESQDRWLPGIEVKDFFTECVDVLADQDRRGFQMLKQLAGLDHFNILDDIRHVRAIVLRVLERVPNLEVISTGTGVVEVPEWLRE